MDSANLENYAWIYVHEDNWNQDAVLVETWFLVDDDIQVHCLEKVLENLALCFWNFHKYLSFFFIR